MPDLKMTIDASSFPEVVIAAKREALADVQRLIDSIQPKFEVDDVVMVPLGGVQMAIDTAYANIEGPHPPPVER